jgi:hypothetical protein
VAGEGLKNAPLGRSLLPKLEGIFMDVEMGSRESDAAIHGCPVPSPWLVREPLLGGGRGKWPCHFVTMKATHQTVSEPGWQD